jgi:hypothetical protein
MMLVRCLLVAPLLALLLYLPASAPASADARYPWIARVAPADTLAQRIAVPPGFERVPAPAGSFGAWLRGLPMKPAGSPVHLFSGALKSNQVAHAAVIDIDVGTRDLQQCADAIMRLRAEWLLAEGRAREIAFDYTGGGRVPFSRWAAGERPTETGKQWSHRAAPDASYASFKRYMTAVFTQAGTYSLAREMVSVPAKDVAIGDVFIKGAFPGHAVLVADVARHPATGETRFLLVQSFMPAQEIHVLHYPGSNDGTPWYRVPAGALITPEYLFAPDSLKRWR